MPLANLAATADLTNRGITPAPGEEQRVTTFLAEASAAVREAAGVPISRLTSTVVLAGTSSHWLRLPGPPVASVASVTLDGTTVTDHKLVDGSLWRPCGWQPGYEPALATVTLTHGFVEVPEDIVGMVCVLVAGALRASRATTDGTGLAPPRGVQSVAIDDYRVQYDTSTDQAVTMFDIPDHVQRKLRARFGGGADVVEFRQ